MSCIYKDSFSDFLLLVRSTPQFMRIKAKAFMSGKFQQQIPVLLEKKIFF